MPEVVSWPPAKRDLRISFCKTQLSISWAGVGWYNRIEIFDERESLMPANMIKNKDDEKLWSRAKEQASKQGKGKNWAYVTSIFQSMKGRKKVSSLMKFAMSKRSSFDFGRGNQYSMSPGPKGDYIRAYRMSQGRSSHTLNRAKRQLPDDFPRNRLGDMHQMARERRPVDLMDIMVRNRGINSNRKQASNVLSYVLAGMKKAAEKEASYSEVRAKLADELDPDDMEKVDTFAASLGLGPKYVPKPEKKFVCPKCGKKNAILREVHADTDMNCMELRCPDCGYEEEDPKELKPSEKTTSKLAKFAQHLLITGVPGVGKTTLAIQRSKELGLPHVELDKYLRQHPGDILDAINSIERPSIIDGVQILEADPERLKAHKIEIVDAPDDRLMRVFLESGSWKGRPDQKEKIREAISNRRSMLNKFVAAMGEDQDRDMDKLSSLMKFAAAAGAKLDKSIKSQDINTDPSEAQKESGTYKKGKIRLYGLEISIENPKGSFRKGIGPDGKEWKNKMKHHYGYIKGTIGKDKDHLDIFIGNNPESDKVFIVNQKFGNKFDEHKIMLGFDSPEQAKKGYLANYEKGWKGLGSIHELSVSDFKDWLKNGNTKKIFKGASMNNLSNDGTDQALKILNFRADWAGPSKLLDENIKNLPEDLRSRIVLEAINEAHGDPRIKDMDVRGVPTLVALRGDRELGRSVGYLTSDRLRNFVSQYLESGQSYNPEKTASRTANWISAAGAVASMIYAGAYLKDRKKRQDWEKKIERSMAARGEPGQVFIPDANPIMIPGEQFNNKAASLDLTGILRKTAMAKRGLLDSGAGQLSTRSKTREWLQSIT